MQARSPKSPSSMLRPVVGVLLSLSLAACANLRRDQETASRDSAPSTKSVKSSPLEARYDTSDGKEPERASGVLSAREIENQTIDDIIRLEEPDTHNLYDDSRYDFPITINSRVEGWIDYFTGRGREHMERYLGRSSRYIPMMKETLKKAGMPQDLVYLALIESGFNLRAKSRARAVGPWQFMKATGKRYGLRVDAWIDERRDPVRSTEAASQYLKDLYLMFESWYLAASAYNAGEYKILRAIEELKTNNYWRICETRLLRRETKDYVPKLIAAAIIARNPQKYGFDSVNYLEPMEFETVTVDFPVHLREIAKLVDAPLDDLEELNPHLVRSMVPPTVTQFELRVPQGSRTLVERAVAGLRSQVKAGDIPFQHQVRGGESLASVARRYRVSIRDLAAANNLSPKEKLSTGLSLIIPGRATAQFAAAKPRRGDDEPRKTSVAVAGSDGGAAGEFVTHTVVSGESLWSISELYDVTVQQIFRWNNLTRSRIFPGKKLKIKSKSGAAAPAAATTDSSNKRGRKAIRPVKLEKKGRAKSQKAKERRVATSKSYRR